MPMGMTDDMAGDVALVESHLGKVRTRPENLALLDIWLTTNDVICLSLMLSRAVT